MMRKVMAGSISSGIVFARGRKAASKASRAGTMRSRSDSGMRRSLASAIFFQFFMGDSVFYKVDGQECLFHRSFARGPFGARQHDHGGEEAKEHDGHGNVKGPVLFLHPVFQQRPGQ